MASSTPFLTASNHWKSPTTSLAVKGLKINSPPLFSWMPLHQLLKISSPIPPGQDVWIRQVVPLAAAVRILNRVGATAAAPTAAAVFFRKFRRVVFFGALSVLSFFIVTTSSEKVMMDLSVPSLQTLPNCDPKILCEHLHRKIPGNYQYRITNGGSLSVNHTLWLL
jgi:hypothetical protein